MMLKASELVADATSTIQIDARRELFFSRTRKLLTEKMLNPDGTGKIPQFSPPWRECLWCLPALYTGDGNAVALANNVVANFYNSEPTQYKYLGECNGRQFGIFQSNVLAHLLHRFGHLMNDGALEAAKSHCETLFSSRFGSAQPDYNFHGANDNMPMMSTYGLILGGEAMGNEQAVKHGLWKLHQLRRHLSRCAWLSEYNSSTYTPITLTGAAKLASYAHNEEIRNLAREIEERLWMEVILHFHPGTFMQSGPQCRAYSIDDAGHSHTLQALFWMAFGPEISGRDIIQSYFKPDGKEVLHFCGNPAQSIAEFVDMMDCDLHFPEKAFELMMDRKYPQRMGGRTEIMMSYDDMAATVHTSTFMKADYSLGTSTLPLCSGEQTNQFYGTYKRVPEPASFKDSASVFCKYFLSSEEMGLKETSADGAFCGNKYQNNDGWLYSLQKDNVAIVTGTPSRSKTPLSTDAISLKIIFPAHYGCISRSVIGSAPVQNGAVGESDEVVPVSIEAGEVFIHIQPLLPTNLPRKAAIRFSQENEFELLELINYEGDVREFSQSEISHILNGFVFTIESKSKFASLEEFHQIMSDCRIVDYMFANHRFVNFQRDDVDFDLNFSILPFGVQSEAIDGRAIERPFFHCNQVDIESLPFVTGKVERNFPFFPWDGMDCLAFDNSWLVGSTGTGPNYSDRKELLKNNGRGSCMVAASKNHP